MTSQPAIPIQKPLVQYDSWVNPLRDISGRNRSIQEIFNDRAQLQEIKRKKQVEELDQKLKEHEEKKQRERVQTKGTFKPLPLYTPASLDVSQEDEDPFFGSVFKTSHDEPEEEKVNTPTLPKILEGQQPTPKKFIQTNEPEEEKVPGGNKQQISRSKITDNEKQMYLSKDDYDKLITLEQDFKDGILITTSEKYKQLKNLRSKISKNKKSGKTF